MSAETLPDRSRSTVPSRRAVMASMAGVMATMLMAALDATIVGTAMPRVIAELNGFEYFAAVTTVYLLTATIVVPVVGKLSDLYGRKQFLLWGVALFTLGSALCGGAQSMLQLVIFRGLQGVGAGFAQAMAFATIADLFPPAQRGRVSGLMGAVFGLASVIGPAVGGFLTDGPGWRWCFWVNLPVGIVAFLILYTSFPSALAPRRTAARIDWAGALTLALGATSLLLALSLGGREYAWGSAQVLALLVAGIALCGVFLVVETRTDEAIIPPSLFRHRAVWTSSVASTLVGFGMFGTTMFVPLFIQAVIGGSATRSGAALTPMMIALVVASIGGGNLVQRLGRYKMICVTGVGLTMVGLLLLARMDVETAYRTVVLNMIVVGAGLGITMPVFPLVVQNAVGPRQIGVATASIQFLRTMGGSVGTSLFGAVLANRYTPAFRAALSADVAAGVSPEVLAAVQNPQALMSGGTPLPGGQAELVPVLEAVRQALASSLHDVFLLGAALVALGLAATALLVDIPLRTHNRVSADAEEDLPVAPLAVVD